MAEFLKAYAPLKDFEGGWCDVSGDTGGETYAGIARNFFPSWEGWAVIDAAKSHSSHSRGALAFSRHLATLPGLSDMVRDWYRREWWDRMGLAAFPSRWPTNCSSRRSTWAAAARASCSSVCATP